MGDDLKTFMSFLCDRRSIEMSIVIKSSIKLFDYCVPSREAILQFYGELFNEFSTYYWIEKKRLSTGQNGADANRNRIEYVGEYTKRFYEAAKLKFADVREDQNVESDNVSLPMTSRSRASSSKSASSIVGPASPTASQGCSSPSGEVAPKIIPIGPTIIPVSRWDSNCNSNDIDQSAPMVIPTQENDANQEKNQPEMVPVNSVVDIFPELEEHISLIRLSLNNLIEKYKLQDREKVSDQQQNSNNRLRERLRCVITKWASDLLIKLNIKHCEVAIQVANVQSKDDPSKLLSTQIEMCLGNPVNKLLVDLLLESHNNIQSLFIRLKKSPNNCDWLLVHLLLETSKRSKKMNTLTTLLPNLKLNLDSISQLLIDKLSAATFNIVSVAQLIKLSCTSLERIDNTKICISTKHRLCMSLATSFFLLLEYESDNFPEILSYIRISLTCMSLLKQSTVASHILCRALLDRSLVHGHLFNENFNPDLVCESNDWTRDESIKLSKENLKMTLGHRFRRLPNQRVNNSSKNKRATQLKNNNCTLGDKPDRQSINSYLLIEAFKSSINNIEDFATLFVEFLCPVTLDKLSWPNDDALRVINERNLSLVRKFEQIPPFWDLYELIGAAGCLKRCLVLVRALLSAHLALWASPSSPDKMVSTSRLIPPLAQSGLIPEPFKLAVEVFPRLAPNEVYLVLSDIWQYLKDTINGDLNPDSKTYLNRLRLLMCQHAPGPLYVKMFREYK